MRNTALSVLVLAALLLAACSSAGTSSRGDRSNDAVPGPSPVFVALETTRGHKGRAARLLGVHANTLTRMLAQMEAESVDLSYSGLGDGLQPHRPNKPR